MDRRTRFAIAMVCYALLALVAAVQLDGGFRWAVWIFLAGLAFKTWIAAFQRP
jgi:hypothetical protein